MGKHCTLVKDIANVTIIYEQAVFNYIFDDGNVLTKGETQKYSNIIFWALILIKLK